MVVRDLSILHDAASIAADVDTTVSFLYVVALGVDVVAEAQLAAASGAPCRLAPSQYLRHVRACEGKATLRVAEQLDVEFPRVRSALRRIARAPGSQIVVRSVVAPAPGGVGAPAPGGVTLRTLRDAVDWAVAARRVENELGPKVLSVEGYRLRCERKTIVVIAPSSPSSPPPASPSPASPPVAIVVMSVVFGPRRHRRRHRQRLPSFVAVISRHHPQQRRPFVIIVSTVVLLSFFVVLLSLGVVLLSFTVSRLHF